MNFENGGPPELITSKILEKVRRDLNPSAFLIFVKLAGLQVVTGFVTMLYCPQFGISLTSSSGVMSFLMKYDEHICMAACGALFLSLCGLSIVLFFRPEELRELRRNQLALFSSLGIGSLGIFVCFGSGVLSTLGMAWFLGSIIGALTTFNFGFFLKRKLTI
jgi:hypothetical protein